MKINTLIFAAIALFASVIASKIIFFYKNQNQRIETEKQQNQQKNKDVNLLN